MLQLSHHHITFSSSFFHLMWLHSEHWPDYSIWEKTRSSFFEKEKLSYYKRLWLCSVKNRNLNPTFPVMSFCLRSWPHVVMSSGHCTQTIKCPSVFQELPKYLRGYHNVTKADMVNIAALLFRIKVGNDNSQFVMIPRMLKELVPADQLKATSENEWRKVRRVWVHHKS